MQCTRIVWNIKSISFMLRGWFCYHQVLQVHIDNSTTGTETVVRLCVYGGPRRQAVNRFCIYYTSASEMGHGEWKCWLVGWDGDSGNWLRFYVKFEWTWGNTRTLIFHVHWFYSSTYRLAVLNPQWTCGRSRYLLFSGMAKVVWGCDLWQSE